MKKLFFIVLSAIVLISFFSMSRKTSFSFNYERRNYIDTVIFVRLSNDQISSFGSNYMNYIFFNYHTKVRCSKSYNDSNRTSITYLPLVDSLIYNGTFYYIPFSLDDILIYYSYSDKTFHRSLECPVFNSGKKSCFYLKEVADKVLNQRYCALCAQECNIYIPACKVIIERLKH